MFVRSLKLYNFRNLKHQELQFSEGLNVIFGKNGQGKTNLVESLNLLSSTKSFRSSKTSELIKWGTEEGSVHAQLFEGIGEVGLGIIFSKEGREYLVNDNKVTGVDFVGKLLSVTFSPSDIEIIKGGPQIRRKFLDKHCVDIQPITLKYILHYNAALKNKLALLKSRQASAQQLDSWDRVLADAASYIVKARREFIEKLQPLFDGFYQRFTKEDGHVRISLKSNIKASEVTSNSIYEQFKLHRQEEITQRAVLVGPHRDDLIISIDGNNARHFASQGQSKSLALALKLAVIDILQNERGESPVILLDDVDSELDRGRLTKLYEVILQDNRQVFITGTEINERLKDSPSEFLSFSVEAGEVGLK